VLNKWKIFIRIYLYHYVILTKKKTPFELREFQRMMMCFLDLVNQYFRALVKQLNVERKKKISHFSP